MQKMSITMERKEMKRYLWFVALLVFALAIAACGGTQPPAQEEAPAEEGAPAEEATTEEEAPAEGDEEKK